MILKLVLCYCKGIFDSLKNLGITIDCRIRSRLLNPILIYIFVIVFPK